jgi:hypothetical protein
MIKAFLPRGGFMLVLVLACLGIAMAETAALTVAQLQRALQAAARPSVSYEEVRESPWLSTPLTSRGTMRSTPTALEKRVESPREETWRLLADRAEWVGPGATGSKQILFTHAPALAALSQVMRRVVAGDLVALQRDFEIKLTGDERVWSAQLQPRSADVARHLDHVELQGTAGQLHVIIVVERQGERTITRLQP